ncbi:MAG: hypothetical protein ACLR23_25875 [Clostridia bacterium]
MPCTRKSYQIIQNPSRFCLEWMRFSCQIGQWSTKGDQVVDLGTGTGIIPILLEAKSPPARFYGLEIQEEMADMARRSVELRSIGASD